MSNYDHIVVPRVNINGTSREALGVQLINALSTLQYAIDALRSAAPHGRDYQTLPGRVFEMAQRQHQARLLKLEEVQGELQYIGETMMERNP